MRNLPILAAASASMALLFGASTASAVSFNLCTETSSGGCVTALAPLNVTITVASDGEASFDPFGAGYDTSDGIAFGLGDNVFVAVQTAGWNQIANQTWVLPACDAFGTCENGPVNEPIGIWSAPGYTVVGGPLNYLIYEDPANGGGLSDVISIYNDANGVATLSFDSNAVPEPATWGLMLVGIGAVGALARRRKVALAA